PSPRILVGWIGPGEGEVGDASLRVAVEILESPRVALLEHTLVERSGPASQAHAALEVWPRASVATVELAPAPGRDAAEALKALAIELGHRADEGPEGNQVAIAKYLVTTRLQKEQVAEGGAPDPGTKGSKPRAPVEVLPGAVHSATSPRLHHALRPWATERIL